MTLRTVLSLAGLPLLAWGALGCERIKADECTVDSECEMYESCDARLAACVLRQCGSDDVCGIEGRCDLSESHCVPASSCSCLSHQACSHGECASRYSAITLLQPAAGARVGSQVTVRARLEVISPFARNDPATLALSVSGGTIETMALEDAGVYAGTWRPAADQIYQLRASYPDAGIHSAPIDVTADRTPPQLRIVVPSPSRRSDQAGWAYDGDDEMLGAWRRDESVTLQLTANEAVDPASVRMQIFGIDAGVAAANVPLSSCPDAGCFEGTVDLSQPQMHAGRGSMRLVAAANDLAGNGGSADGGIDVTRVRWIFFASLTDPIRTTPAIGPTGRVYFGTASGSGTAGALWAVDGTGELKWTVDAGAVEASPAVGDGVDGGVETIYAAFNTSSTTVLAAFGSAGNEVYRSPDGYTGQALVSLGIGDTRYFAQGPVESAFILLNDATTNGKLVALRPAGGAGAQSIMIPDTGFGEYPSGAAVLGTKVFFPDDTTSIHAYDFAATGWSILAGWPFSVGITVRSAIPILDSVLGTAGVTVPPQGGGFSIETTGGISNISWQYPSPFTSGPPAWFAIRPSNDALIYPAGSAASGASLVRVVPGTDTSTSQSTSFLAKSAPLVSADGTIYLAGTATKGRVGAFRSDLSPEWGFELPGTILASPNMDCRRDASGARLAGHATLYVATTEGRLYSIITDSPGIDTTAPWPRYQHDPRNTGNAGVPLAEFACP